MEYYLVTESDVEDFNRTVNLLLDEGWVLYGSPSVSYGPEIVVSSVRTVLVCYSQAMTLNGPEK